LGTVVLRVLSPVLENHMKGGRTTADPRIWDDEARDETHIIGFFGLPVDDNCKILLTTKIMQHVNMMKMIQDDDSFFLKIFQQQSN
jgi:hypothetical protein